MPTLPMADNIAAKIQKSELDTLNIGLFDSTFNYWFALAVFVWFCKAIDSTLNRIFAKHLSVASRK
jgi:hypothetical protein